MKVGLGADDLARPGLMLCPWVQVGDDYIHGLLLQVLGWDSTNFVGDFVPFHRHILTLNANQKRMYYNLKVINLYVSQCCSE